MGPSRTWQNGGGRQGGDGVAGLVEPALGPGEGHHPGEVGLPTGVDPTGGEVAEVGRRGAEPPDVADARQQRREPLGLGG